MKSAVNVNDKGNGTQPSELAQMVSAARRVALDVMCDGIVKAASVSLTGSPRRLT